MADKNTKFTFRVKAGRVFGLNGEYKAGDEVELTAEEAEGFKDKLEPAGHAVKSAPKVRTSTKKDADKE